MSRGEGGGAPIGNQNAKKLTTPELKEAAYKQYCDHIASGEPRTTWYFDHPDLMLTWETMEVYMKNDIEFPSIKRKIAETKGYAKWIKTCADSARGDDKGKASTASLNMYMRNVYGWDKPEKEKKEDKPENKEVLDKLMTHLDKPSSNIATKSDTNL